MKDCTLFQPTKSPNLVSPCTGFGFLAYALTCVVALTALAKVRRTMWEVFYYVHGPASKLIYVMGVLHLQGKAAWMAWMGWLCAARLPTDLTFYTMVS